MNSKHDTCKKDRGETYLADMSLDAEANKQSKIQIPWRLARAMQDMGANVITENFSKLPFNLRTIMAMKDEDIPTADFVLPNFLAGTVGSLISSGGAGKTFLALQMATQIASGENLFGLGQYPTGKVLFLGAEDPDFAFISRFHAISKLLNNSAREKILKNLTLQSIRADGPNILDDNWLQTFYIKSIGHRLIILDTFRRFHWEDENLATPMSAVLNRLEIIAEETGCSIMFLHHSNKNSVINNSSDQQQAARGSSVLTDNCRWQSFLKKMTEKEAEKYGIDESLRNMYVQFGISKANYGNPFNNIWLKRNINGLLLHVTLEEVDNYNSTENGKNKGTLYGEKV
jgi:RecA-family ATPase